MSDCCDDVKRANKRAFLTDGLLNKAELRIVMLERELRAIRDVAPQSYDWYQARARAALEDA